MTKDGQENYLLSRDKKRLIIIGGIQDNCYLLKSGNTFQYVGYTVSENDAIEWLQGNKIPLLTDVLLGPQTVNVAGYLWA